LINFNSQPLERYPVAQHRSFASGVEVMLASLGIVQASYRQKLKFMPP